MGNLLSGNESGKTERWSNIHFDLNQITEIKSK